MPLRKELQMSALTTEIAMRDLYAQHSSGRLNYAQYSYLNNRLRCDTRGMSFDAFRINGGSQAQYDAIERGYII